LAFGVSAKFLLQITRLRVEDNDEESFSLKSNPNSTAADPIGAINSPCNGEIPNDTLLYLFIRIFISYSPHPLFFFSMLNVKPSGCSAQSIAISNEMYGYIFKTQFQ